jgi:hypothetical protein
MNEVDQLQALTSTVARLEAEVRRMNSPTDGATSLVRARRGQRWALWLGAAGLCSLPMLGWAAVSLTEFQSGDPIVAADVNTNFSNINVALDGPLVFAGQPVNASLEPCSPDPCQVPNAELEITTAGGRVEIRFVPVPQTASSSIVGTGGNGLMRMSFILQRSADDGVSWEDRSAFEVDDFSADFAEMRVSPSTVLFLDDPAAGTWRYRLAIGAGQSLGHVDVIDVHLVAREFAVGS